ncbi:hypothetical protein JXL19_11915 [bacterium]|nr:hypothetical protein [bacterium]
MNRIELDELKETAGIKEAEQQSEEKEIKRILCEDANKEILRQYGDSIPVERHNIKLSERAEYQNKDDFEEEYFEKNPDASKEDIEQVIGYKDPKNEKIYINKEVRDQYEITVHEGLHMYEDKKARLVLGDRLCEGITQYFTKEIDKIEFKDDAKCYIEEKRVVDMIAARVGDKPLREAYFKGDASSLRRGLDWQLGDGAFDEIRKNMDRGDHSRVRDILKYGL